ncbi:MAG TPA: RidA family protein [Actinomycetota bacterium]|nr:RidA family protein [Actinomycetota bacterium]
MDKAVVTTGDAPAAIGPYSQAVVVGGTVVYCSGQVALDAATGELVGDTVGEQTRRALENLGAVLAAAGSSFDRVVKVTAYLTDMADFPEFNDVYGEFFTADPPARATVGVAALPKGARVEVECIAGL